MHSLRQIFEAISLVTAITTLAGWIANALPPMASLLSIMWLIFQFYHSEPMRARRARKMKEDDES